jgi:transcriptional regulator with XRE-family HTH domain
MLPFILHSFGRKYIRWGNAIECLPLLKSPNMGKSESAGTVPAPHPVDAYVGARLRMRRTVLGLSQERLGEAIGLTFQQVQKYERGTNRISASRLFEMSVVLNVSVGFFYEGYIVPLTRAEAPAGYAAAILQRDALELMGVFQRIADPEMRRRVLVLAKGVANVYFDLKAASGSR